MNISAFQPGKTNSDKVFVQYSLLDLGNGFPMKKLKAHRSVPIVLKPTCFCGFSQPQDGLSHLGVLFSCDSTSLCCEEGLKAS